MRGIRNAGVPKAPDTTGPEGDPQARRAASENGCCFIYAHFIPGRYSSLVDVMMNGGGATIGVAGDMAVHALSRLRGSSGLS